MISRILQRSDILNFSVLFSQATASYAASYRNNFDFDELQDIETWHLRLGHLHKDMIKRMAINGSVTGIQLKHTDPSGVCFGYVLC